VSFAAASRLVIGRSLVNWARLQLRRLRRPRYLVWTLGMVLWLGTTLLSRPGRTMAGLHRDLDRLGAALPGEALAGAAITALALQTWFLGKPRRQLGFSEADVQHLFPAPVSRGALLGHALARQALMAIAGAPLFAIAVVLFGGAPLLRTLAGTLLVLLALVFHGMAASVSRAALRERLPAPQRRLLLAGGVLLALALLAAPFASDGPLRWLAWPARTMAAPFLAEDGAALLAALPAALLVVALQVAWVLAAAGPFEEDAVAMAEVMGRRVAAVRADGTAAVLSRPRGRRRLLRLSPTGRPELALAWRGLVAMSGPFKLVPVFVLLVVGVIALVEAALRSVHGPAPVPLSAIFAGLGLFLLATQGPTMGGGGLQGELGRLDLLKALPLSGGRVVLGHALAPALALSALWLPLALVTGLLLPDVGLFDRACVAAGLAVAGPPYLLLAVLLQAGLVAWLPGWFTPGGAGARRGTGFLGMLVATLATPIAALPAAGVAFLAWLLLRPPAGWGALPVVGLAFAGVAAVECAVAVILAGHLFERIDPAAT
jgi:hypothetical protein